MRYERIIYLVLFLLITGAWFYERINNKTLEREYSESLTTHAATVHAFARKIEARDGQIKKEKAFKIAYKSKYAKELEKTTDLKNIITASRFIIKMRIDTLFMPFSDSTKTTFSINKGDTLNVTGHLDSLGVVLDSLSMRTDAQLTIGFPKGLKTLFKTPVPNAELRLSNRYMHIDSLHTIVVSPPRAHKWLWFGAGAATVLGSLLLMK